MEEDIYGTNDNSKKPTANDVLKYIESNRVPVSEQIKLIKSTGDVEFIKQCIYSENFEFEPREQLELIAETKDPRFIEKVLASKEFDFEKEEKEILIASAKKAIKLSGDKDLIKQYINDKRFKFNPSEKAELISTTGDVEYIKQCIENKKNRFNTVDKVKMIESTESPDIIKQFQHDKKLDKLTRTVLSFKNDSNEFYKKYKEEFDEKRSLPTLKLPPEMTIGIEIESEGEMSDFISNMEYGDWKAKDDGSLEHGVEVVSPILKPSPKDNQDIYVICSMLRDLGQDVTERCGAHVHIGADYLTEKASYINLLALWGNAEKVIYEISNPPKEIVREDAVTGENKSYAMPISGKLEKAIENGTLNLDKEENLDEFISKLQGAQNNKYSGINFMNIGSEGKNTIEFRTPNGTIDPKTWIENINLFGGIVKVSEELTQIQKKPEEQRTEEEKRKVETFNKICSGQLTEKEVLDSLLDLTVSEEQRPIYEQRYEKNSKLYKHNRPIEKAMKTSTAQRTIQPKDIGRSVFTGESAITGMEMQDTSNRLVLDINRTQQREDLQATI